MATKLLVIFSSIFILGVVNGLEWDQKKNVVPGIFISVDTLRRIEAKVKNNSAQLITNKSETKTEDCSNKPPSSDNKISSNAVNNPTSNTLSPINPIISHSVPMSQPPPNQSPTYPNQQQYIPPMYGSQQEYYGPQQPYQQFVYGAQQPTYENLLTNQQSYGNRQPIQQPMYFNQQPYNQPMFAQNQNNPQLIYQPQQNQQSKGTQQQNGQPFNQIPIDPNQQNQQQQPIVSRQPYLPIPPNQLQPIVYSLQPITLPFPNSQIQQPMMAPQQFLSN